MRVHPYGQLRRLLLPLDGRVRYPRHGLQQRTHLPGDPHRLPQVIAAHLHGDGVLARPEPQDPQGPGARAHHDTPAGDRQDPAKRLCHLLGRPLPLRTRGEPQPQRTRPAPEGGAAHERSHVPDFRRHLPGGALQDLQGPVGYRQVGARGQAHVHEHLALVRLGEQLGPQKGEQRNRQQRRQARQGEHRRAAAEGGAQHAPVSLHQGVYPASRGARAHPRQPGGQHGSQGQGDEQRAEQGEHHHEAELYEHLGDQGTAAEEHHGQEHHHRGQGGCGHCARHLLHAPQGRFPAPVARLPVPEDVLEDHDRGVDQHADPQGQGAQGHQVHRVARKVHEGEGCQQGDGDGGRYHQHAAQVAQKQPQDAHRQACTYQQRLLHGPDGAADKLGAVSQDVEAHVHQLSVQPLHLPPHPVRDRHGVDARLPLYLEEDPGLPVHAHATGLVRQGAPHHGHVLHPHGPSASHRHNRGPNVAQVLVPAHEAHGHSPGPLQHLTRGRGQVGARQRLYQVLLGDAQGLHARAVGLHPDLLPGPAPQLHHRHARDPLHPEQHLLLREPHEVREAHARARCRHQADLEDGHLRRVELEHYGRGGPLRQPAADPFDGRPEVRGGRVQVPAEVEGGGHPGSPEARDRHHVQHAWNRADRLFDHPGDEVFHLLRPGSRVVGDHRQARARDLRQQVDGQPREARHTHQDHRAEDDAGPDRPGQGQAVEIHGCLRCRLGPTRRPSGVRTVTPSRRVS
ncbi:hypothetical protein HRbin32_00399 [bacterium HR32]|nr:hypothetical protein HRbin32_00399 [bacterium HR32]